MMRACIAAEHRTTMNKSGLKRMRQNGRIPGVVMGLNQASDRIHLSAREFGRWVRAGGTGLLDIRIGDSEPVTVLLEDVQRDPVTGDYIHIDLLRVKHDEKVRAKVALHYVGTPKGTKLGGSLQTQSTFIEIQALPHQLMPSISVDISELNIGDSLLAGQIELPPEVTLLSPDNELLLSVLAKTLHMEESDAEEAV